MRSHPRFSRSAPHHLAGVGHQASLSAVIFGLALVVVACGVGDADGGTAITIPATATSEPSSLDTAVGASEPAVASVPTVALSDDGNAQSGDPTVKGQTPNDAAAPTTASASDTDSDQAAPLKAELGTLRPGWVGTRTLPTTAAGLVPPQSTPPEMEIRRFPTIDLFPRPRDDQFRASIEPVNDQVAIRSTWQEGCPVSLDELRYLRLTFWGFDGSSHEGEMIVHRDVADDVVAVFGLLHGARYPIEEMRVTAPGELDAPPTGDGNNTTSFVCRAVVGGSKFSEHASGLAIDVNPFQNPYRKGEVVLPELATSYLERQQPRPGMIVEGGPVIAAFDSIGWGWGGRWSSLSDYHHFSLHNR